MRERQLNDAFSDRKNQQTREATVFPIFNHIKCFKSCCRDSISGAKARDRRSFPQRLSPPHPRGWGWVLLYLFTDAEAGVPKAHR